jgi:uncharacterized protein DUF4398
MTENRFTQVANLFPARGALTAMLSLLSVLSLGCSSSTVTNNPALERARVAYQRARQDPEIVGRAAVSLDNAGQTLDQAELLWTTKKDMTEVEHLAYLAEKRVEIARFTARRRLAADEIKQLRSQPK